MRRHHVTVIHLDITYVNTSNAAHSAPRMLGFGEAAKGSSRRSGGPNMSRHRPTPDGVPWRFAWPSGNHPGSEARLRTSVSFSRPTRTVRGMRITSPIVGIDSDTVGCRCNTDSLGVLQADSRAGFRDSESGKDGSGPWGLGLAQTNLQR